MPCYDKKIEAVRPENAFVEEVKEVDAVLATHELVTLFEEHKIELFPNSLTSENMEIEGEEYNSVRIYLELSSHRRYHVPLLKKNSLDRINL